MTRNSSPRFEAHADRHVGIRGCGATTGTNSIRATSDADPCIGAPLSLADSGALSDGANRQYGWQQYGDNADCRWALSCSDPAAVPTLAFSSFKTEGGYDFVAIFDGPGTTAPRLAMLSGVALPPVQVVTGPAMLVQLTTDGDIGNDGFEAAFVCQSPAEYCAAAAARVLGLPACAGADSASCPMPCAEAMILAATSCQQHLAAAFSANVGAGIEEACRAAMVINPAPLPMVDLTTGCVWSVWSNIGGRRVDDLTSDPRFPWFPDSTGVLNDLFEAPTDAGVPPPPMSMLGQSLPPPPPPTQHGC